MRNGVPEIFQAKQMIFNFQEIENVKKAINQLIKIKPSKYDYKKRQKAQINPTIAYQNSIFPKSVASSSLKTQIQEKPKGISCNNGDKTAISTVTNDLKKRQKKQYTMRFPKTIFYYISNSQQQRLCSYNQFGRMKIIDLRGLLIQWQKQNQQIRDGQKINNQSKGRFRYPAWATPVVLQNTVYFVDPYDFQKQKMTYLPSEDKHFKIKIPQRGNNYLLERIQAKPIQNKIKCAIVCDNVRYIYLIGGLSSRYKIPTRQCQRYDTLKDQFERIPNLKEVHTNPNACILKQKIYMFSRTGIQVLNLNSLNNEKQGDSEQEGNVVSRSGWACFKNPFNAEFHAFHFSHPISQNQILIFGGVYNNKKLQNVQILNVPCLQKNQESLNQACFTHFTVQNIGDVLPQPLCQDRSSQPVIFNNSVAVLGSVQGSVFSSVQINDEVLQATYINAKSCYLQKLLNVSLRDTAENILIT